MDEDQGDEQSEDDQEQDSYEFELTEMEKYEVHRRKIDKQRQLVKEKQDLVSFSADDKKKKDEDQPENSVHDSVEEVPRTDPAVQIRNDDLRRRICERSGAEKNFDILLSGTSATIVILTQQGNSLSTRKMHVAWVGDCPVLLWGNPSSTKRDSFLLNEPLHKPTVDAERFRIYNNNGEIRETHDGVHRVFLRARMYPGLNKSRSIGDLIPH